MASTVYLKWRWLVDFKTFITAKDLNFYLIVKSILIITCDGYLLSHIGNGALQLPEGRHTISEAPMRELPFMHENFSLVFIFVLWVLTVKPLLWGTTGQWTAENIYL